MAKALHNWVEEAGVSQVIHRVCHSAGDANLLDGLLRGFALLVEQIKDFAVFHCFKGASVATRTFWRSTLISLCITILLPISLWSFVFWAIAVMVHFGLHLHWRGAEPILRLLIATITILLKSASKTLLAIVASPTTSISRLASCETICSIASHCC